MACSYYRKVGRNNNQDNVYGAVKGKAQSQRKNSPAVRLMNADH